MAAVWPCSALAGVAVPNALGERWRALRGRPSACRAGRRNRTVLHEALIPDLCRISFSDAVTSIVTHHCSSRPKCHCVVILSLLPQLSSLFRCRQCSFHLRHCDAVTSSGATFSQLAACRLWLDNGPPDLTVMHHSTVHRQTYAAQNLHRSTMEQTPDLKLF